MRGQFLTHPVLAQNQGAGPSLSRGGDFLSAATFKARNNVRRCLSLTQLHILNQKYRYWSLSGAGRWIKWQKRWKRRGRRRQGLRWNKIIAKHSLKAPCSSLWCAERTSERHLDVRTEWVSENMRSESSLFCRQSPPNGVSTSSLSLLHIDLPSSCNSALLSVTGSSWQNSLKEINKSKALFIICLCCLLGTEIGRCCIHLLLFMWGNTAIFRSSRGDLYLPLPNILISFSWCPDLRILMKRKMHVQKWHQSSAQSALTRSHQHVRGEQASGSEGGWRWQWWRWMVWGGNRWAIDLPQHISAAPFTEPITSPAAWCVDNWAVARVSMFLLQPDSDTSYCIVFYFNTIYNKEHPAMYLCQYPSRRLSAW